MKHKHFINGIYLVAIMAVLGFVFINISTQPIQVKKHTQTLNDSIRTNLDSIKSSIKILVDEKE